MQVSILLVGAPDQPQYKTPVKSKTAQSVPDVRSR